MPGRRGLDGWGEGSACRRDVLSRCQQHVSARTACCVKPRSLYAERFGPRDHRATVRGGFLILEHLRSRQVFAELAALDESVFPLDRAALAIALEEYPDLNTESYLSQLDTLAARVEVLAGYDRSPLNVLESLNEVLFIQEGLRGNTEDYYDPRNSFLNAVLETKNGIPISLSVIYLEVARRINFEMKGVGFPSHFIVK